MRLLPYDAYHALTRVFSTTEPIVAIDVGANEGVTSRRIVELFPHATVYAFEGSPETYERLRAATGGLAGVRPVPLAAGPSDGEVEFRIAADDRLSGVLPASELGQRFYAGGVEVRRTVKVPMVRLDEWAAKGGLTRVDLLKVDTQGFDLHVLRGCAGLLAGVRAINCEFQFAQEYEGCSTFSQIDQFLVESGFALYQIHEVWTKGNEEQTSWGDGLWLRADVLAALRARKDLPDLSPGGRVARALAAFSASGRIAVYGAGRHTRRALAALGGASSQLVAVIDDDPALAGNEIQGVPVMSAHAALRAHLDGVILSSDTHEAALWRASAPLRAGGLRVIPLYAKYDGA
ncbi:MAG: FkbM family methyltransferase [Phycisphaerales bacterium]|nr:FkbM family methyltransferase [Phycisphaerales bacterium]